MRTDDSGFKIGYLPVSRENQAGNVIVGNSVSKDVVIMT